MDLELLDLRLEKVFGSPPDERRVVVRTAGDLRDSGRYRDTHGEALTVDTVVGNLADAPAGSSLVDRWNWWIGALDLTHTGYQQFRITQWGAKDRL